MESPLKPSSKIEGERQWNLTTESLVQIQTTVTVTCYTNTVLAQWLQERYYTRLVEEAIIIVAGVLGTNLFSETKYFRCRVAATWLGTGEQYSA